MNHGYMKKIFQDNEYIRKPMKRPAWNSHHEFEDSLIDEIDNERMVAPLLRDHIGCSRWDGYTTYSTDLYSPNWSVMLSNEYIIKLWHKTERDLKLDKFEAQLAELQTQKSSNERA